MTSPGETSVLAVARRAWFLAGVRRRDRRALSAELVSELTAAGDARRVLGDDPARAAREWAVARGLANRRLRLLAIIGPALLAGLLAAGAVLVTLAFEFAGAPDVSANAAVVLTLYASGAVFAVIAVSATVYLILRALRDPSARRTAWTLAVAVPIGGVVAACAGVVVADLQHFTTRPHTFVSVCLTVAIVLAVAIALGRKVALDGYRAGAERPEKLDLALVL